MTLKQNALTKEKVARWISVVGGEVLTGQSCEGAMNAVTLPTLSIRSSFQIMFLTWSRVEPIVRNL